MNLRLLYLLWRLSQPHSVTCNWVDTVNPPAPTTTYNVYRGQGTCDSNPTYTKVASGLTVLTFKDANVPIGRLCYYSTAVVGGLESNPSNLSDAAVVPFAPSSMTTVVE